MELVRNQLFLIISIATCSGIIADNAQPNVTDIMSSTSFEYLIEYDIEPAIAPDIIDEIPSWTWLPLKWTWWMIIRVMVAVVGIVGNGVVIVIIYQRLSTIRSTDVFIGSLAIADLLTSVFLIPIPYAKRVPATILGHLYCKIIYPSFCFWLCIVASTYILMTMCIERYIAVVFPLYFNRIASNGKATVCILGIWLVSFLQCLYTLFVFVYDERIGFCSSSITTVAGQTARAYYAFTTRLAVPVMVMLISQILIACFLNRQAKRFHGIANQMGHQNAATGIEDTRQSNAKLSFHLVARNRIIKMMLNVVLVYIFCWTPNQIVYFFFNLGYIPPSYRGSPLHNTLTVLGFINCCANPFIYAARNPEFRNAVLDLIYCTKPSDDPLFGVTRRPFHEN